MKFSYALILIMALLLIIVCLFIFVAPKSHAQDLFDRAEIEFDIDYIDIDKVKILGGTIKGQVMAVWMKSGSVLTKTLSKSNVEYEYREFDSGVNYDFTPESIFAKDKIPIEELRKKPGEELVSMAGDLITGYGGNGEWGNHTTYRLFDILLALKLNEHRGSEFVQIVMDVINASLKNEIKPRKLLAERSMLLTFAKGDEQLTKMANDFLEENGFNKEN